VARAGDEVVIGEPDGLHEGVDDGGADEAEPAADHVLADGLRLGRLHRDLAAVLVARRQRLVVHERPHVLVQRTEVTAHLQGRASSGSFFLFPAAYLLQYLQHQHGGSSVRTTSSIFFILKYLLLFNKKLKYDKYLSTEEEVIASRSATNGRRRQGASKLQVKIRRSRRQARQLAIHTSRIRQALLTTPLTVPTSIPKPALSDAICFSVYLATASTLKPENASLFVIRSPGRKKIRTNVWTNTDPVYV
jgi:hypothetical protein